MTILTNLSINPIAKQVIKRPLPVKVTFAKVDGICKTLEGNVEYLVGDAIITGIVGERWPVQRAKFDENYVPLEGFTNGKEGLYAKKPLAMLALRLDVPVDVKMTAGGMLHGMPGDWIIQYAQGEYGIVKDEIFQGTYDFI